MVPAKSYCRSSAAGSGPCCGIAGAAGPARRRSTRNSAGRVACSTVSASATPSPRSSRRSRTRSCVRDRRGGAAPRAPGSQPPVPAPSPPARRPPLSPRLLVVGCAVGRGASPTSELPGASAIGTVRASSSSNTASTHAGGSGTAATPQAPISPTPARWFLPPDDSRTRTASLPI
eukprot:364051-Chlamydomonas_euryale.AAC.7